MFKLITVLFSAFLFSSYCWAEEPTMLELCKNSLTEIATKIAIEQNRLEQAQLMTAVPYKDGSMIPFDNAKSKKLARLEKEEEKLLKIEFPSLSNPYSFTIPPQPKTKAEQKELATLREELDKKEKELADVRAEVKKAKDASFTAGPYMYMTRPKSSANKKKN